MPTEFATATISAPPLLLRLGKLRAESMDRSFSGYVASLLREDTKDVLEQLRKEFQAQLDRENDPEVRTRLAATLKEMDDLEMGPTHAAGLILAETYQPTRPLPVRSQPPSSAAPVAPPHVSYKTPPSRKKRIAKQFPKG